MSVNQPTTPSTTEPREGISQVRPSSGIQTQFVCTVTHWHPDNHESRNDDDYNGNYSREWCTPISTPIGVHTHVDITVLREKIARSLMERCALCSTKKAMTTHCSTEEDIDTSGQSQKPCSTHSGFPNNKVPPSASDRKENTGTKDASDNIMRTDNPKLRFTLPGGQLSAEDVEPEMSKDAPFIVLPYHQSPTGFEGEGGWGDFAAGSKEQSNKSKGNNLLDEGEKTDANNHQESDDGGRRYLQLTDCNSHQSGVMRRGLFRRLSRRQKVTARFTQANSLDL